MRSGAMGQFTTSLTLFSVDAFQVGVAQVAEVASEPSTPVLMVAGCIGSTGRAWQWQ